MPIRSIVIAADGLCRETRWERMRGDRGIKTTVARDGASADVDVVATAASIERIERRIAIR